MARYGYFDKDDFPKHWRCLTWKMALLIFITFFGFLGYLCWLTTPMQKHQDAVRRLQTELHRLDQEMKYLAADNYVYLNYLQKYELEVEHLYQELNELKVAVHPQAYTLGNFALEAHGAQVIHNLSSRTHQHFPWLTQNTPATVIKGQNYPLTSGYCWAFKGQAGYLYISLSQDIHVTHVTLGHITKQQSPTGDILSAPSTFTVYAQKYLHEPETKLGTLHYNANGGSFQTFRILQHKEKIFRYVKLEIQNNHGNTEFTCLYNFRVHGQIPEVTAT